MNEVSQAERQEKERGVMDPDPILTFPATPQATPVVFVHGTGGSGAAMREYVEAHLGEGDLSDCALLFPSFQTPYQFLLPDADQALISLLHRAAELG